jgi:hypothetical protein
MPNRKYKQLKMHKFIQLVANSYSTDGKPESLEIYVLNICFWVSNNNIVSMKAIQTKLKEKNQILKGI